MAVRPEILYFVEDRALSHMKNCNVAESLDCRFERILLPHYLSDLNPIEELWWYIKDQVKRRIH